MAGDRILPASWWSNSIIQSVSTEARLLLLWLTAEADGDGIAPCLTHNQSITDVDFRGIVQLIDAGLVGVYRADGKTWAWVPSVPCEQPLKGPMRVKRDLTRPPPPQAVVAAVMTSRHGTAPTKLEARQACPRAWGKTKRAPTGIASADIRDVWMAWRNQQKSPNACRLGASAKRVIEKALREADKTMLIDLVAYAYESNDAGPRFWRGENATGRTYLGLDNLFVGAKLAGRLQSVAAWKETNQTAPQHQTDLGPLARYRELS